MRIIVSSWKRLSCDVLCPLTINSQIFDRRGLDHTSATCRNMSRQFRVLQEPYLLRLRSMMRLVFAQLDARFSACANDGPIRKCMFPV